MFFCFTSPWAIQGKAADAVARCGQLIVQRCRADLLETNRERRLLGLEPHSPLTCEWVHGPFKADSKFVSSMERKGFRPLDVIEKEWPEIPLQAFPPLREIFIPNRCALFLKLCLTRCLANEKKPQFSKRSYFIFEGLKDKTILVPRHLQKKMESE